MPEQLTADHPLIAEVRAATEAMNATAEALTLGLPTAGPKRAAELAAAHAASLERWNAAMDAIPTPETEGGSDRG